MSQTMPPDREVGELGGPDVDDRRDLTTTPNQLVSNFGDSSGPLFSMYSKAAEDEDKKMVESWQKDADGILIFTGLFSAAVAALLAVTVQDLRPNSQDTSAFYLGNIYQVLADPNVTRSSTPSSVTKPPSFSPSGSTIWVNSLWFLSLVMSLSCALWATSLQQWARRYLYRTQPSRCSPEKRARMRAFFTEGVETMHISWAVEGLPMLLHLSLFLFFGGLAIFLFDVNHEVFGYVMLWIVLFLVVYGLITLLPIIRHDSPYHSPLSTPAWFLYASIHHVTFKILTFITSSSFWSLRIWRRCKHSRDRYQRWMLGGVEKAAEETVSERSSEIDVQILDWTISAHGDGDDNSLKSFLEAIPGFFDSKLVKRLGRDFPVELLEKFRDALGGFLDRTWSSNLVDDSEKVCRLGISVNATNQINETLGPFSLRIELQDELPQTTGVGHALARWCTNNDQDIPVARLIIPRILVRVRERNESWIVLAARVFGLPERNLRDNIALGGDSVLLAILIHVTRQFLFSDYPGYSNHVVLATLTKLEVRNTYSRLQHDFCTLWNEVVQEARNQGAGTKPVHILRRIRHLYIALHQGTDAAPTAFSASTNWYSYILQNPSSYPVCNLASHRPDSIARIPVPNSRQVPLPTPPDALFPSPTDGGNTASRLTEQVNNVIEPTLSSNPTTNSEIGLPSHGPDITPSTDPIHSGSRPTGALPTAVVTAALPDTTSTATLSHLLEGSEQQDSDIVAQSATQIPSTASTPAYTVVTLVPISTPPPNNPSGSYDVALPSIRFSMPASRPTGSATLPCLRARGLVNTENTCFANAVLQLLVNSPPSWNLFRELGNLKGQHKAGLRETETPLVDASVRFFNEFISEESPSTQQQSQPATGGTSRADSFEPTYLYDAMKEGQLERLLKSGQQDAEEFLGEYLDALDEELPVLLSSIKGGPSACTALEVEECEVSQSGQSEVGNQGFRLPIRTSNKPNLVTKYWRSLQLDVLPDSVLTVQDALMRVSLSQSTQDGPSGLSDVSQQMFIEALPPGLVLHLKRFQYDAAAGSTIKNGKPVQFPPELEIPFDVMVPTAQQPAKPVHYTLCGVLYHHGESASDGHYTVDVLRPNGDSDTGDDWLHIDNEKVTPILHADVFGGDGTKREADEWCAYILFYCRSSR